MKYLFFVLMLIFLFAAPMAYGQDQFLLQNEMELDRLAFLINSEIRGSGNNVLSGDHFVAVYMRSLQSVQTRTNLFARKIFQTFIPFEEAHPEEVNVNFSPSTPGLTLKY
jgi:hypothetical protein